ncbi:MAG: hypothetical protein K2N51_06165 [Lachnospiraceae bacterium]|nr:hypothetical protein [Lachnospiraceae bacterium]
MGKSIFWQFFSGIPIEEIIGKVPLLPFGRWLFPIGVYLLIAGSYIEKRRNNDVLVCYRYGSRKCWWNNRFWKGLAYGIPLALLVMLPMIGIDMLFYGITNTMAEIVLMMGLWTLHIISMLALFLGLDLQKEKRGVPAILLLLEGITILIGYSHRKIAHFMYGMWGMYVQSNLYDNVNGFTVSRILFMEVLLIVIIWLCGRIVVKERSF